VFENHTKARETPLVEPIELKVRENREDSGIEERVR
jgi:hypothetical protein